MHFTTPNMPLAFKSGIDKALALESKDTNDISGILLGNNPKTRESFWEMLSYQSLGLAQPMNEGDYVQYDSIAQARNKEYTPIIWQTGELTSMQAKDQDIYSIVAGVTKRLRDSMTATRNYEAANVYNEGFSGSGVLGPDGKTLFATDHPLGTGALSSTASNRGDGTNDLTLDGLNLETAMTQLFSQVNERGIPMTTGTLPSVYLFVPPALFPTAKRVVESQGLQGTSDNDINAMRSFVDVVPSTWLGFGVSGQTDAWFLRAKDNGAHGLFMLDRRPPQYFTDFDIDILSSKVVVVSEFLASHYDWRYAWGSNP